MSELLIKTGSQIYQMGKEQKTSKDAMKFMSSEWALISGEFDGNVGLVEKIRGVLKNMKKVHPNNYLGWVLSLIERKK